MRFNVKLLKVDPKSGSYLQSEIIIKEVDAINYKAACAEALNQIDQSNHSVAIVSCCLVAEINLKAVTDLADKLDEITTLWKGNFALLQTNHINKDWFDERTAEMNNILSLMNSQIFEDENKERSAGYREEEKEYNAKL